MLVKDKGKRVCIIETSLFPFFWENRIMKNNKSAIQKSVYYSGFVSFVVAIACLIILYLKIGGLGWQNPISASLMATSFFFASVGVVLLTMGSCNIPSFKVSSTDS